MAESREDQEPMSPDIAYLNVVDWNGLVRIREFLVKIHRSFFSVVDSESIFSLEQIRICYSKALKIVRGEGRIRMPESAFLMLLSGQNQISKAQEEVGVSTSTKSILVVYDSQEDFAEFLKENVTFLMESAVAPVPEKDLTRDWEIFTRMTKVQLSL